VFTAGKGSCVAFLTNYHMNAPAKVVFNNRHYTLPAWSISILPDCRNVVFNTATVSNGLVVAVLVGKPLVASC